MDLTRRDAVAALVASGVTAGAITASNVRHDRDAPSGPLSNEELATVVAIAEVVYPSAVNVTEEFVETYSLGRLNEREDYVSEMRRAASELDGYARRQTGKPFRALEPQNRDTLLRDMGVARVHPDGSGTVPERVRYYLVNDLLYALFSTPTGGKLIGLENPPGYPGGLEAYQRGPDQ